jgi:Asp-tRNA(Asn)/Glu-tRNA(Gln) amidotransferase A subunit family amidase
MEWDSIADLAEGVRNGKLTASDLVKKSLRLIEENKEFNSVIATVEARALERASFVDELVGAGKNPGKLAGVPFIAKDNFLTFGSETTA